MARKRVAVPSGQRTLLGFFTDEDGVVHPITKKASTIDGYRARAEELRERMMDELVTVDLLRRMAEERYGRFGEAILRGLYGEPHEWGHVISTEKITVGKALEDLSNARKARVGWKLVYLDRPIEEQDIKCMVEDMLSDTYRDGLSFGGISRIASEIADELKHYVGGDWLRDGSRLLEEAEKLVKSDRTRKKVEEAMLEGKVAEALLKADGLMWRLERDARLPGGDPETENSIERLIELYDYLPEDARRRLASKIMDRLLVVKATGSPSAYKASSNRHELERRLSGYLTDLTVRGISFETARSIRKKLGSDADRYHITDSISRSLLLDLDAELTRINRSGGFRGKTFDEILDEAERIAWRLFEKNRNIYRRPD